MKIKNYLESGVIVKKLPSNIIKDIKIKLNNFCLKNQK